MSTKTDVRVGKIVNQSKNPAESVVLDSRGVAYIDGTTMKVRQVIMEAQRLHSSAEEIQDAHAHDNITMEHVQSALKYYESHKKAIDDEIDAEDRYIEEARRTGYQPDLAKLRERLKQIQPA